MHFRFYKGQSSRILTSYHAGKVKEEVEDIIDDGGESTATKSKPKSPGTTANWSPTKVHPKYAEIVVKKRKR